MITSRTNEKIKEVCELMRSGSARIRAGLYVVEGPRMIREIPEGVIVSLYASESFAKKNEAEMAEIAKKVEKNQVTAEITSDDVFSKMSATRTPQGILAICKMPHYEMEDLIDEAKQTREVKALAQNKNKKSSLLIIEGIQDPGNLGTMFRSVEAAGASGIIMDETTVDPFNPKVIRSTMGSIFRVPFIRNSKFFENIKFIKSNGYTIYAAHLEGKALGKEEVAERSAFMIGNEGNGLSTGTSGLSDKLIKIPMEGKVESLNASVAASLLLYEWHRVNF